MRELSLRVGSSKELLAVPVLLLAVLTVHFGLLPAHLLPAHDADTVSAAVGVSGKTAAPSNAPTSGHVDGHDRAVVDGSHHADSDGHGPPYCHDGPAFSWAVVPRLSSEAQEKLGACLLLLVVATTLEIPLLSWLRTRHRRWSPCPPWRPSGTDLLAVTCVLRT